MTNSDRTTTSNYLDLAGLLDILALNSKSKEGKKEIREFFNMNWDSTNGETSCYLTNNLGTLQNTK